MRYVETKPVRACIVPQADAYRWSSAPAHQTGPTPVVCSPSSSLNRKGGPQHGRERLADAERPTTSVSSAAAPMGPLFVHQASLVIFPTESIASGASRSEASTARVIMRTEGTWRLARRHWMGFDFSNASPRRIVIWSGTSFRKKQIRRDARLLTYIDSRLEERRFRTYRFDLLFEFEWTLQTHHREFVW